MDSHPLNLYFKIMADKIMAGSGVAAVLDAKGFHDGEG